MEFTQRMKQRLNFGLASASTVNWQFVLGLLILFSLSSQSLASAPPEEEKESPLSEANEALRFGEYEEAEELYEKLLENDDLREKAVIGIAESLLGRGNFSETVERLKKDSLFAKSSDLQTVVGRAYLKQGLLKEALEQFKSAVELNKKNVAAVYLMGETQRRSGLIEEAKKTFNASIDLYRDATFDEVQKLGAEGFVYWGLSLVGLNRVKEAHELMFDQANEIDSKNPLLMLEWGKLMASKYNFPDSRSYYRDALDQNPYYADALVALADNYLDDFQVGTRRYNLAEKQIKRALEVQPEHAGAHANRGLVWIYDGDYDKAIASLNRSLKTNPSDLRVLGLLASCAFMKGDEKGLEEIEKRALKINPKGAEFFHTIAQTIEKKFQYPLVVKFCDKALALDPDYWPAYTTLGINCLRTGEEKRGRQFLQKSWDSDRYNVYVFNTREFLGHLDDNFTAHKNKQVEYFLPKNDMAILRPYLEPLVDEAIERMSKRYKTDIFMPLRIESFAEHKWFSARTVGLEGFAASGACFGRLVTLTSPKALPQNWGAVAWHELAHVFTLEKTNYRIPRWLTEGISVYEEGLDRPHWGRGFGREIADAWISGRILGIGEFDFGFTKPKFPGQILLSYYQGCLVVEYIVERWGFEKIIAILDGYGKAKRSEEIFKEVLGIDLVTFDKDFDKYVGKWVEKNGYTPRPAEGIIATLELEVEAQPEDEKKLIDLAWAYVANGNGVDGQITVNKVLEKNKESGDAHALLGFAHLQEKKSKPAQDSLKKALELGTRFKYRAHAYLGNLYSKEKDTELAIEHYEKAKKASPDAGATYPHGGPNLYYKLHKLYEDDGDEEKALQQMAELAELSPEDGECRLRLVKAALVKKDAETAFKYLDQLMYINPFDMQLHRWLSHVAEELEKHEIVIREVQILMNDPRTNELKSRMMLAKAYLGLNDKEKAKKEIEAILKLDPEHKGAKELQKKL